jgi:murein DD-endopeptidase MepM/ murein hydrolase activator NlpD
MNRRTLLATALALPGLSHSARAAVGVPAFAYPIGWPGQLPGDGFLIRHGYATENTWYNPGYWHTGEDWYALDGETAGAEVRAIAAGVVVFAGSDYPGRVVIMQHEDDLYSMYGHLDYSLPVAEGDTVERGQTIGTVLLRSDGAAPSHLHFEVRTFLMTAEVNGDAPRYGFACGFQCPPGPGYWPIDAPEHPTSMGWRNPTHAIARRSFPGGDVPAGIEVAIAGGIDGSPPLFAAPDDPDLIGELPGRAGTRYALRSLEQGRESSKRTSAAGYHLWYQIGLEDGSTGWAQAAVPASFDTGSDGRPSSIELRLLVVPPNSDTS